MIKNCMVCGKIWETGRIARNYDRAICYCSKKCYWKIHKNPEKPCLHCGKLFQSSKSNNRKFCSLECYNKNKSFNCIGNKYIENATGRVTVYLSENTNTIYEHRLIAENAIGKKLTTKQQVHHIDLDKTNNSNNNLVICEDQNFHMLLHQRTKTIQHGGNPNTEKVCSKCKIPVCFSQYSKDSKSRDGLQRICKKCDSIISKNRTRKKKL